MPTASTVPVRSPFRDANGNMPSLPWIQWFQSLGASGIGTDNSSIIFVTPSANDTVAIRNAIDNLPARGGIVALTPGRYQLLDTITVQRCGVKIIGFGGRMYDAPKVQAPNDPTTLVEWAGANGGTMFNFSHSSPTQYIADLALSSMTLDCQSKASIGLKLDAVALSRFSDLHIWNPIAGSTAPLLLTTTATVGNVNTQFNLFEQCSIVGGLVGVRLSGNGIIGPNASNCSHNTFIGLNVVFGAAASGESGIKLEACDNNLFLRTFIFRKGGTGAGVLIEDPVQASSNYFMHLQASDGGFIVLRGASSGRPNDKSIIVGYDRANGQPVPSLGTGFTAADSVRDYAYWLDSRGESDVQWSNLSSALTGANCPATRANELGFVFDGTNEWVVFNDGINKWKMPVTLLP